MLFLSKDSHVRHADSSSILVGARFGLFHRGMSDRRALERKRLVALSITHNFMSPSAVV
jgi:hypothetical protein